MITFPFYVLTSFLITFKKKNVTQGNCLINYPYSLLANIHFTCIAEISAPFPKLSFLTSTLFTKFRFFGKITKL